MDGEEFHQYLHQYKLYFVLIAVKVLVYVPHQKKRKKKDHALVVFPHHLAVLPLHLAVDSIHNLIDLENRMNILL